MVLVSPVSASWSPPTSSWKNTGASSMQSTAYTRNASPSTTPRSTASWSYSTGREANCDGVTGLTELSTGVPELTPAAQQSWVRVLLEKSTAREGDNGLSTPAKPALQQHCAARRSTGGPCRAVAAGDTAQPWRRLPHRQSEASFPGERNHRIRSEEHTSELQSLRHLV